MLRQITLPFAAVLAATALVPAAAGAATVSLETSEFSSAIVFEAAPGETNRVTIKNNASRVAIFDTGGTPVTATAPCTQRDAATVDCPIPTTPAAASVTGGDGDDTFDIRLIGAPFTNMTYVDAGDGDDQIGNSAGGETTPMTVSGGPGNDRLSGGAGNDYFFPGPGKDTVEGQAGDDTIYQGPQAGEPPVDVANDGDLVRGWGGTDRVTYSNRTGAVRVSLNNTADDGEPGEADNIADDVEVIEGTGGDDGLNAENAPGPVTLLGGGGRDNLGGSAHDDTLNGGAGDDGLFGNGGNDDIAGGDGNDVIWPGAGKDRVDAGAGEDNIQSNDAPRGTPLAQQGPYLDTILCGGDADIVGPDLIDFKALANSADCETVYRPVEAPVLTASGSTKGLTRRSNRVLFRGLVCAKDARDDCKGRFYVESGTTLVARGTLTLKPGKRGSATLKLTSAGKKMLKKRRSVKVKASYLAGRQGRGKLGTYRLKR